MNQPWITTGDDTSYPIYEQFEVPPSDGGSEHFDNYACFESMTGLEQMTGPYTAIDTAAAKFAVEGGYLKMEAWQSVTYNGYGGTSFPYANSGSEGCVLRLDGFRAEPGAGFMTRIRIPVQPTSSPYLIYIGMTDGLGYRHPNFTAGACISSYGGYSVLSPMTNNPIWRHLRSDSRTFVQGICFRENEEWDIAVLTGIMKVQFGSAPNDTHHDNFYDIRDVIYTPEKLLTGTRQQYNAGALLLMKRATDTNWQPFGPLMHYRPEYKYPTFACVRGRLDVKLCNLPKNDLTKYALPSFLMEGGEIKYTSGTSEQAPPTPGRQLQLESTDDGSPCRRPPSGSFSTTQPKIKIPNMSSARIYRDGGCMLIKKQGGPMCAWNTVKQNHKHSYDSTSTPNSAFFATRVEPGFDPCMDTVVGTMANDTHTSSGYFGWSPNSQKALTGVQNTSKAGMWAMYRSGGQYWWHRGEQNWKDGNSRNLNYSKNGCYAAYFYNFIICDSYGLDSNYDESYPDDATRLSHDDGRGYRPRRSALVDNMMHTTVDFWQTGNLRSSDNHAAEFDQYYMVGSQYNTSNHNAGSLPNNWGIHNICLWEGVDMVGLDQYFQCFPPVS